MSITGVFLQEMSVLYAIGLLGFIANKTGVLTKHSNDVLTRLVLYITLPALILFSLDLPFHFSLLHDFIWLVSMSIFVLGISIMLAKWMAKKARLSVHQLSVYEGLIIFGNQGFIGYAIIYILFQEEGIVYLTMFNLVYLFLIWSYGILLFTRNKKKLNWKLLFLNPGIVSTSIGLFLFLLPIQWPSIVSSGMEMVGKMTIPLSMIIIGNLIASVRGDAVTSSLKSRSLWYMALAKLIIIPLSLLAFALFPIPSPLLLIAVLVSGMPSAPTISLYAQKFGGDAYLASIGVLLTTMLCLVTIPFLYWITMYLS